MISFVVYFICSIVVIGVMTAIILTKYNCKGGSKDNFCNCQGMDKKVCPNPRNLQQLYNEGILTEFTPLTNKGIWKQSMPPYIQFQEYPDKRPICSTN